MEKKDKPVITVEATVNAPIEKVWNMWTDAEHIKNWCYASDDWHAPNATNDIRTGGKFSTTMAAKDGSFSFDFGGVYTNVKQHENIEYEMGDGRRAQILFAKQNDGVKVTESFEAESINPLEMQQGGWQSILNNFKKYTESH